MNERIRELAISNGIYDCITDPYDLLKNGDPYSSVMVDLERFAELIVEECRYVMDCNKGSDQNPAWNQSLSETSEKIKQHFGVEE